MAKEPKKLDELFHDTLKDIYFAEKKILSTLQKMAKAAQNKELTAAFEKHRGETEGQVELAASGCWRSAAMPASGVPSAIGLAQPIADTYAPACRGAV
jgi:hypothetical protein